MKYVALLRGINVGGKNAVRMADLKQCFIDACYSEVSTYINSGNVIFETAATSEAKLVQTISDMLKRRFGWPIACAVVSAHQLGEALRQAPSWWEQDPTAKHNAIFVIAPATAADIMRVVGAAKPEYEQVAAVGSVIFWTAPLATFSRTRYSKIVGTATYQQVTIRNANTTRKLLALLQ